MKVCLLSDTHGFIDDQIISYLNESDEIWHAGDFGTLELVQILEKIKPVRGVYGNIDDNRIRSIFPEEQIFEIDALKILMTHIGGYPPTYNTKVRDKISQHKPGLFICGHSHILKIIGDHERHLLHINPGAAGHHGFHKIRTMVRFEINVGTLKNLEVIELGKRGK